MYFDSEYSVLANIGSGNSIRSSVSCRYRLMALHVSWQFSLTVYTLDYVIVRDLFHK